MTEHDRLLRMIVFGGFIAGIIFGIAGVVLVYLGAIGETEFSLFGQTFKSTNAGIGALFISATLIILLVRRALGSMDKIVSLSYRDREGAQAPGQLVISDIQVTESEKERTCTVDFRVTNRGGTDVIVNAVQFYAIDVAEVLTLGFMEFSKTYDLDISDVRHPGEFAVCRVSQLVRPGEADRFGIVLIATRLGTGVFRAWRLVPILATNFGDIRGSKIEICLPHKLYPFSKMKEFDEELKRRLAGVHEKPDAR